MTVKYLTRLVLVSMILTLGLTSCEAQRRVNLQRGLERALDGLTPVDSAFITSDALGRAGWITLDSTRSILGVDTLEVTGKHFFNYGLTQEAPVIKHLTASGDFMEIEGKGSWLWDDPGTWEVDAWTGNVGGRINIDDGIGTIIQGMDGRIELTTNQIYAETDNSFFQISDFSGGRIVFRSNAYRFSDGSGGQYPPRDDALDSVVVLDNAGFMHVRSASSIGSADNLYTVDGTITGVGDRNITLDSGVELNVDGATGTNGMANFENDGLGEALTARNIGGGAGISIETTDNNNIAETVARFRRYTGSPSGNGIGLEKEYYIQNSGGQSLAAEERVQYTDVTLNNEVSTWTWRLRNGAGSIAGRMVLDGTGYLELPAYGSGSTITGSSIAYDAQIDTDGRLIPVPIGESTKDTLYSDTERVIGVYSIGGNTYDVYQVSFEADPTLGDYQTPYSKPGESGLRVIKAEVTYYDLDLNGDIIGATVSNGANSSYGSSNPRWYWSGTLGSEDLYIELDDIDTGGASYWNNALIQLTFIRP